MPLSHVEIPSPSRVASLLGEVLRRVILPYFRQGKTNQVRIKGRDSIVTEADVEAEKFLASRLQEMVAGSQILGEEFVAEEDARLQNFLRTQGDLPYWLVDPIDGTKNFVQHSETFCIMLALVLDGAVRASWIYSHQQRAVAYAIEGQGAFLEANPIRSSPSSSSPSPSPSPTPTESKFCGRISWTRKPLHYDRTKVSRLPSISCAGQDFLDLAQGKTQFSYYNQLWPWDHAPGVFLLHEAGGRTAQLEGASLPPGERVGPLLAVADASQWQELQKHLGESITHRQV